MIDAAYVLALMLRAEKNPERSPHRPTYERTAEAIAKASNAKPLFDGARGPDRTAALLVSLAWFETNFKPDAEGDCTKGGVAVACTVAGAVSHSVCAFQINDTNWAALGVTRAELMTDIDVCVDAGLRMAHTSFAVCRAKPLEHRLDHYAFGRECEAVNEKGVHRVRKGVWLFDNVKPASPRVDATDPGPKSDTAP